MKSRYFQIFWNSLARIFVITHKELSLRLYNTPTVFQIHQRLEHLAEVNPFRAPLWSPDCTMYSKYNTYSHTPGMWVGWLGNLLIAYLVPSSRLPYSGMSQDPDTDSYMVSRNGLQPHSFLI